MNILTRNVPNAIGRDNWAKNAVAKLEFSHAVKDPAAYLQTACTYLSHRMNAIRDKH
jgi:hypothetical protein